MRSIVSRVLITFVVFLSLAHASAQQPAKSVLWTDPGDISAKNLFDGPGGKSGRPQPPFKFDKQLAQGTSPKFDVTDGSGEKWRVKLGPEAHAEPVASRLLWAVGYFANENYFEDEIRVEGIIPLGRGDEFQKGNTVSQARLQRKLGKHDKPWSWAHNPFKNTREFNGLRVMMALLHNWDLKDENNARFVDKDSGREIYYVSDVGSSFGTTGESYTVAMSKSNLKAFRSEKFIAKVTPEYVDFNFPTHPVFYTVFNPPLFYHEMGSRWIGRKIPRDDVRWIASLLSQLIRSQIEDAFRAGGYSSDQVKAYADVLQARIEELSKL